jgi:hypothetical protein
MFRKCLTDAIQQMGSWPWFFDEQNRHCSGSVPHMFGGVYHEVTVVTADEQFFEYLNCRPRTGMLRAG